MNTRTEPEGKTESTRRHEHLAGEHAFTDTGQLILIAVFLVVWIVDSFVVRLTVFPATHVPPFVRWPVGIALLAASGWLALSAHRKIFASGAPTSGVVTDGAYAIVRHPMYLGSWGSFLGLALTTLSLASVGVLAVMLGFYLFVSGHEEKLLLARHGAGYREYRKRTPMFFPLKLRTKRQARVTTHAAGDSGFRPRAGARDRARSRVAGGPSSASPTRPA